MSPPAPPLLIAHCSLPPNRISSQTILIGPKCWMAENSDFRFQISDLLPQTDNCIPEKYAINNFSPQSREDVKNANNWNLISEPILLNFFFASPRLCGEKNLKRQTSNAKRQVSNVKRQTSNAKCQIR
jgi:hypothetical protein